MSFDPFRLKRLRCSGTEGFADLNLPILDVCIDVCRLPLFIVRATLRGLIAGLEARAGGGGARVSQSRSSLFVSFDRATGWVFARIMPAKTAANARRFLRDLHLACPILIAKILTDTGKEFTNRLFASRARAPYGALAFDWLCTELGIEHRLTPPKSPQTNGMVERFNGGIRDVLKTNRFDSALDLKQTVHRSPFTVLSNRWRSRLPLRHAGAALSLGEENAHACDAGPAQFAPASVCQITAQSCRTRQLRPALRTAVCRHCRWYQWRCRCQR